jgi:hypothetical protein
MPSEEFIIKMIEYCAWPVTVIIVITIFRGKVTDLLKKLEKFKYKDVEFHFSSMVREVGAITTKSKEFCQSLNKDIENEVIKLYEVSKYSTRSTIIQAYGLVENELMQFYMNSIKGTPSEQLTIKIRKNIRYDNGFPAKLESMLKKIHYIKDTIDKDRSYKVPMDLAVSYTNLCAEVANKTREIQLTK